MCEPHNDLVCSHSPETAMTTKLSLRLTPATLLCSGNSLSHSLTTAPTFASTAETVEQDKKSGATDLHE